MVDKTHFLAQAVEGLLLAAHQLQELVQAGPGPAKLAGGYALLIQIWESKVLW